MSTPTPTASKVRIPVRSISIEQVEGAEGGKAAAVRAVAHSFQEANALLAKICDISPRKGATFEVEFGLVFGDGNTYAGSFNAAHPSSRDHVRPDLAEHVRLHLEFMAGLRRPKHMTEEAYAKTINSDPKRIADATRFLTTYALEDVADAALAVPLPIAEPLENLISIMAGMIRSLEEDAKLLRRSGNPSGAASQDQRSYEIRKALVFIQKAKDVQ